MALNKEIILTQEGIDELNREKRKLIDEELPSVIEQLQAARSMGDLSENADYSAAKDRQSIIESRIKEIETILVNAKVVEVNKKDKSAGMGKYVVFENLSNNKQIKVLIVSTEEASPYSTGTNEFMKISTDCPIGMALVGHKVGDIVTVKAKKPYDIKILSVDIK